MQRAVEDAQLLGLVGVLLLAGYAAHVLGRRTHVPRVTILLLLGVVVGPAGLDLAPAMLVDAFPLVTQLCLSLVGFLLGERIFARKHRLRLSGLAVLAATETFVTAGFVFLATLLAGQSLLLALLLAAVAPASDPIATVDVARESRARGPVTDAALGVVAVDDAYGIILFSVLLAIAQQVGGTGAGMEALLHGLWEVGGALLLGFALGLPMAALTGRLQRGEPTLVEALGFVLTCCGLAVTLNVSYLLACMAMGAVVPWRAKHHRRPFHAIEGIADPFLVLFFMLAGFEFDVGALRAVGAVALLYVLGRALGKIAGNWLGAQLSGSEPKVGRWLGLSVMPQAGVALGLGLMAAERFPEVGSPLLSLLVGTTLTFELAGPLSTRFALRRAGECK